jgi:predicted  nucleic acid-binding Zn-ribbon protein
MTESPFRTFIELIRFDRVIAAIEQDIKKLATQVHILQEQERAVLDIIEKAKSAAHQAQKDVDTAELEMKSLDAKEKEKKYRLENVTNHKEYQSLKAEIDVLQEKQVALEKQLLQAWHSLELAQKAYEQKQQESVKQLADVKEQKSMHASSMATLQKQIDEQRALRPEKEKQVPAEWLEKYAAMRSHVADPVVPVNNGICSACFYKVSDQDLIQLRRNKLLQCKDCYRFLYIESPENKIES